MNNPFYFQPDQWLVIMTTSLLSQSSWKPLRSIFKTLGLFLALQDLLIVLLVLYFISCIFLPQPLVKLKAPTSELPTPESPPSPSTPSVKSRMQQQVGLILRLSEQLMNWRLYGGGQGWWRGSNLSRDPFHPQNCPTELVVREHIVQQTLVRKEEK